MGAFVAPLAGHLNVALTNYQKAFRQNGLFSDVVAPRVPVGRETDYYYIWGREDQMLNFQDVRAPGSGAQRVRRTVSTSSYHCRSHALAAALPHESRANLEQAGLGQAVSQMGQAAFLQKKILLAKEAYLAALMTTAIVTQNTTLVGGDQWSTAGSDPAGVIATAKQTIQHAGVRANLIIIGEDVYTTLKGHAQILDSFKYIQKGVIGLAELAAFWEVDQVQVAASIKVAADGSTATPVWDADDVLICYVDPNPSNEDMSFAKTFVWAGAPGTVGGYGVVVGPDPDITAKTEVVGVDMYYDQKITAVEAGYLVKNAVA